MFSTYLFNYNKDVKFQLIKFGYIVKWASGYWTRLWSFWILVSWIIFIMINIWTSSQNSPLCSFSCAGYSGRSSTNDCRDSDIWWQTRSTNIWVCLTQETSSLVMIMSLGIFVKKSEFHQFVADVSWNTKF